MASIENGSKSELNRMFRWLFSNTHRVNSLRSVFDLPLGDGFGLVVDFDGVFLWCNKDGDSNLVNLLQLGRLAERASWVMGETGRQMKSEGKDEGKRGKKISNFPVISRRDLQRFETLLGSDKHPVTFQTGLGKYLGRNYELSERTNCTLREGHCVLVIGSGVGDLPLVLELVRRSGVLSDGIHFAYTGCF